MAWENVSTAPNDVLERWAVAGGWLYRNRSITEGGAHDPRGYVWKVSLAFVPDAAAPPPPVEEATPEARRSTMDDK